MIAEGRHELVTRFGDRQVRAGDLRHGGTARGNLRLGAANRALKPRSLRHVVLAGWMRTAIAAATIAAAVLSGCTSSSTAHTSQPSPTAASPTAATAPTVWVCRPGGPDTPC